MFVCFFSRFYSSEFFVKHAYNKPYLCTYNHGRLINLKLLPYNAISNMDYLPLTILDEPGDSGFHMIHVKVNTTTAKQEKYSNAKLI